GRFLDRGAGASHRGAGPGAPAPGALDMELVLSGREQRRKRAMIDCFASQAVTLAPFRELEVERYRLAPGYDFTRAPHPGRLLYEQWQFPMSGAAWRGHAARGLRALGLHGDAGEAQP